MHCLLPPALSQARGKMKDDQRTENPLTVIFLLLSLSLRNQINFLPMKLRGEQLFIKDNYKEVP